MTVAELISSLCWLGSPLEGFAPPPYLLMPEPATSLHIFAHYRKFASCVFFACNFTFLATHLRCNGVNGICSRIKRANFAVFSSFFLLCSCDNEVFFVSWAGSLWGILFRGWQSPPLVGQKGPGAIIIGTDCQKCLRHSCSLAKNDKQFPQFLRKHFKAAGELNSPSVVRFYLCTWN